MAPIFSGPVVKHSLEDPLTACALVAPPRFLPRPPTPHLVGPWARSLSLPTVQAPPSAVQAPPSAAALNSFVCQGPGPLRPLVARPASHAATRTLTCCSLSYFSTLGWVPAPSGVRVGDYRPREFTLLPDVEAPPSCPAWEPRPTPPQEIPQRRSPGAVGRGGQRHGPELGRQAWDLNLSPCGPACTAGDRGGPGEDSAFPPSPGPGGDDPVL